MLWLAFKTLFYERGRLFISLIGISFSTILALIGVAFYFGMMANATSLIRNTDGDIWITSKNIQNFDFALPFPEERINQVRALPDILWAEKILYLYGFIKLPNGGRNQVVAVGFNPDNGIGGPWSMYVGRPSDVKGGRYMIMDKTSEQQLGRLELGTIWELSIGPEQPFKVVGFSQGIKSFTTVPVVFISYQQGQNILSEIGWERYTFFIIAKVRDKNKIDDVMKALRSTMRDNDVFKKEEFVRKTVIYWTVQTGMGMAFFIMAAITILIGGTIVGQTIYASTMEHLREYGTLKAIGARNRDIYQVIFSQAGISAIIGYIIGTIFILLVRGAIERAGVSLYLDPLLFILLFVIILLTCLLSAYFSVGKIRRLDPVTVFRG